jgi:solute carrier family 1 (high affinity glutamate transporter) protein 1
MVSKKTKAPVKSWLLPGILAGMLLGGVCGWFFGEQMLAVKWMGDLFLNALKMIIVPLIICSIISGIASLGDVRKLGSIGGKTVLYYLATTGISVLIGLVLVNVIQPGVGVEKIAVEANVDRQYSFVDVLMGMIPQNIFKAMADGKVLPLIVVALVFGGIFTTMGARGKKVLELISICNEAVMKLVHLIMLFTPFGIFALVAARLGQAGGGEQFMAELSRLGLYSVTVLSGLLIHGVVVLPLILLFVARVRPWAFFKGMGEALACAFGTASSSATLPLTMDCAQNKNGVPAKATSFVLPLGATVNMDGTALYEAVAVVFIAQMHGIELSSGAMVIVFLTATLAAIGAAGIPEAGLVTMVMVLKAVDLPVEGIAMILAVDWFLDRCRTTVNAWGDAVGSAVIARLEGMKFRNTG